MYSRLAARTPGSGGEEAELAVVHSNKLGSSPEEPNSQRKYSKFSHKIRQHKRACSTCHKFPSSNWKKVRKEDAFPDISDYPKHQSCLNCHRTQFFRGGRPAICTICHTNPSPRNRKRQAFPNPREAFDKTPKGRRAVSEFAAYFPHDKHADFFGANLAPDRSNQKDLFIKASFLKRAQNESCVSCHSVYQPQGDSDDEYLTTPPKDLGDSFWLKKGTTQLSPRGHAQCFTCHSTDGGVDPVPQDCGTCHKLETKRSKRDFGASAARRMRVRDKNTLIALRKRNSSATFRHEWFSHSEMDCVTCHKPELIKTEDAIAKRVAVSSCSGCHITATADDGGILNYEIDERKKDPKFQCVKCHIDYGRMKIPESHSKAIADLAGK